MKLAGVMFLIGIVAMVLVLFLGYETKGAKRWLMIFGVSVQPSELIKPAFLVVSAWLLAEKHADPEFRGMQYTLVLLAIVSLLTVLQPDIGMTLVIAGSCFTQIFIAGMPLFWVFSVVAAGIVGLTLSYFFIPHVTSRIDSFFHPELIDADQLYQIRQSIEAFHHGGWFGCGPGEGIVKRLVPDAHSDFVFSVAGEEYGLLMCAFIASLFAFIVIRSLLHITNIKDLFIVYSVAGLAIQFGLQAFVNMSTALRLIPTKGMTLPFVSYGGSSMLAIGIGIGMILSLTRKRHGLLGDI
jgi:cell division protein FtsW